MIKLSEFRKKFLKMPPAKFSNHFSFISENRFGTLQKRSHILYQRNHFEIIGSFSSMNRIRFSEKISKEDHHHLSEGNLMTTEFSTDLKIYKLKIEREINKLEQNQESILSKIDARVRTYLLSTLVLYISLFGFFYYTIYMVSWLGWDIMEPITYSLEVITILLAVRFFKKYKLLREFESVKEVFLKNYLDKNPLLKESYYYNLKRIDSLQKKKEKINKYLNI